MGSFFSRFVCPIGIPICPSLYYDQGYSAMNLGGFLQNKWNGFVSRADLARTLSESCDDRLLPFQPVSWPQSISDPTAYYLNCTRFFHSKAPAFIREHRNYFQSGQRGFGEDSFHIMWQALFEACRPKSFLEIGVYRGQVLSLVSLLAQQARLDCRVCGVSPFSPAGDSVSRYIRNLNYFEDTLANFRAFSLPSPRLIRGSSTDPSVIREFSSNSWDWVYIDGNHEYVVAKQDFLNCSRCLSPGGKIILDDSALFTSFKPPRYATAGHPGPSRLAGELSSYGFTEVLQVGHNRVFQKSS
jgi:SAM-dependent methyltransferase